MRGWEAEGEAPRPRYLIGFELATGRIVPLVAADALAWAQTCLIQMVVARRAAGGGGALVLLHVATDQVRERIVVTPGGPPDRI
jgi:hypothetical protein